ncbi:hypothetical protein SAMN04490220_8534 [Rhodococcus jostii]|uniref:Uncharacterized protein n=1 Tax=Rhodococcus jostii TaxID=132919 RepID=A0A1H5LZG5_RHOJO|nr:hypothetical protein SAMN04490220_8534 [Rhodococcus jostii]
MVSRVSQLTRGDDLASGPVSRGRGPRDRTVTMNGERNVSTPARVGVCDLEDRTADIDSDPIVLGVSPIKEPAE